MQQVDRNLNISTLNKWENNLNSAYDSAHHFIKLADVPAPANMRWHTGICCICKTTYTFFTDKLKDFQGNFSYEQYLSYSLILKS